MILLKAIGKALRDFCDPVCQNPDATLFGKYKGVVVRLRPVIDPKNPARICEWITDPNEVDLVDRVLREHAAPAETPAETAAPTPGFNPAGTDGL